MVAITVFKTKTFLGKVFVTSHCEGIQDVQRHNFFSWAKGRHFVNIIASTGLVSQDSQKRQFVIYSQILIIRSAGQIWKGKFLERKSKQVVIGYKLEEHTLFFKAPVTPRQDLLVLNFFQN